MKIGVDVGGTNTDAVIMEAGRIIWSVKRATTDDVGDGIERAIRDLLLLSNTPPSAIASVTIGTTQFTNAFIEARHLAKVAAVRIGLPAARDIPAFATWPARLSEAVHGASFMVRGGHEFDGKLISPLDEHGLRAVGREIRAAGLTQIAVTAVFSQLNAAHELRAAEILRDEVPGAMITLSHAIGRTGLLERENAALMNASLRPLASQTVVSYRRALESLALNARLYVSQNDGSLMQPERVESHPVLTFAAGPTNSLRGAAFLSGMTSALVADIGGTTTDIGVLVLGFPRQSALHVDIGGVRTNFRAPDVLSIGVGGGSRIRTRGRQTSVGPDSVGFDLKRSALVFGGETLTATDVAVGLGRAQIGDSVKATLISRHTLEAADLEIHRVIENGLDRMKSNGADMPLILVGGGAIMVGRPFAGISEVHSPEHADVANAVGAAIGKIGGDVDRIFHGSTETREERLRQVQADAGAQAAAMGADPATLETIELEEFPLQYIQGGAVRIVCRVAGDLLADGAP